MAIYFWHRQDYGLEQNFWAADRSQWYAPLLQTLRPDFLSDHRRFDGDWNHAIAAYNSGGGGRVSGTIHKDSWVSQSTSSLWIYQKETNGYIFKLLAWLTWLPTKKKYGIDIPAIPNKPVLTLVTQTEQLDLALQPNYSGIPVKKSCKATTQLTTMGDSTRKT